MATAETQPLWGKDQMPNPHNTSKSTAGEPRVQLAPVLSQRGPKELKMM